MKNEKTSNEKINTLIRTVLGATGVAMLVAFFNAATAGGTFGNDVYLGLLAIIPITMAITGFELIGRERKNPATPALHPAH